MHAQTLVERCRQALTPVIALLASGLALTSAVSVPDVQRSVLLLYITNGRWVGWAGVALAACVSVAALAAVTSARVGVGPPLALGAAGAVFGLALADSIDHSAQVVVALVALSVAFGGLITGGALLAVGLPRRTSILVGLAWSVPLVAGWPIVTWLLLHGSEPPGLALHPPAWALVAATSVIVLWASLSVLTAAVGEGVEPTRRRGAADWSFAWLALLGSAALGPLVLMVLGFDAMASTDWARSMSLLTAAVMAVGLAATARWVPYLEAKASYLATLVVLGLLPACIELILMTADDGNSRVGPLVVGVLASVGVLGVMIGLWRARLLPLALAVMAVGAAGSWIMPNTQWPMLAGAAGLLLGGGAALGGSVRLALGNESAWRFLAVASVVALATGLAATAPMSWALSGSVADGLVDARAAGRVGLGVLFVASVLAAAVTAILLGRSRSVRLGESTASSHSSDLPQSGKDRLRASGPTRPVEAR